MLDEIFQTHGIVQRYLLYTFADEFGVEVDIGTVRETFFVSCFESIYYSDVGDFIADGIIYEVGGKNKKFKQIKDVKDSFDT